MGRMVVTQNLIDLSGVTISASSEGSDLPASNVAHPFRSRVWRTGTSITDVWVKFNLGSAMALQSVVLLDHDLKGDDTLIRLQGNSSDSWDAPSVSESLTFPSDVIKHYLSTVQTYQWWRVTFRKSAAGETRDIGRIYLGPDQEFARGPAKPGGLRIPPTDLSKTYRALGGETYSEIKSMYDLIEIDIPLCPDEQIDQMKALAAACGVHTPLFVAIDPALKPYDLFYYCKAESIKPRKVEIWGSDKIRWGAAMRFAEEL